MARRMVEVLLKREPGAALCDACLAFACSASVTDVHGVTETLIRKGAHFQRGSTCASCRRAGPTTFYRELATCVHCSQHIVSDDAGVIIGDQPFHVHCLRRLVTDDTIRLSRTLSHRSRQLIEQSRRRTSHGEELTGPSSAPPASL
jgi:hypothetical protein